MSRRSDTTDTGPGPALSPARLAPAELCHRLLEHVRIPLHRDAYALALNSAFTAATGLLYWIVAAKAYSARAVGVNSALISAMMFLAGIASLNLPNIIVRFLPESGDRILPRVVWAYAVSTAVAACAAVIFIVGVGSWTPRLSFLHADRGLQAWFVFSTVAWCVFAIQDSVLTALGRAVWVPVENGVFSFAKLGLLAAAAVALRHYGIFVSWTVAMLVSVAGVNFLIFTRLMRRPDLPADRPALSVRNRAFMRYFAADYACSVAWLSTANLIPVIVTAVAGATTNAYWALAYAVALPLYSVSTNIGTSLMLHGTTERAALPMLTRKAAIQGARLLIPTALAIALFAPTLLSLFGPAYTQHSATVLRLLALGALPNFLVVLAVSVARVQRRLKRAVIALAAEAIATLGLATPLIHKFGVSGVGAGWLCAQCVVAVGLLLTRRTSFALDNEGATASDAQPQVLGKPAADGVADPGKGIRVSDPDRTHPVLRDLFAALQDRGLCWMLLRTPSNPAAPTGDVDLLVAPGDAGGLRDEARRLGFVALPGWESAPDLILVRYDRTSDHWLLLDVSTSVSFRSPRSWRLVGASQEVLAHRRWKDGLSIPSDADAFWLLLLHCLLDKGQVASHHASSLRRLAPAAPDSQLGSCLCAAAGRKFAPDDFVMAAHAGEVELLRDLGIRLAASLRRRRPLHERLRVCAGSVIRVGRQPLLLRRRKGLSLALLGPNGVGKSTAAAGLERTLPFELRVVYMGMWAVPNRPRRRAAATVEIVVRPLRLWGRYLVAQYHQFRGRVVVFDRYVYEALLPPRPPLVMAKRMYFWCLAHAIPGPRLAVVLDVPGEVAYGRKQENPPDELESERHVYRELAGRTAAMAVVDAAVDADSVRAEITNVIWTELVRRWQKARP
jgi:O-antigen/teichoic acid export membrane protein